MNNVEFNLKSVYKTIVELGWSPRKVGKRSESNSSNIILPVLGLIIAILKSRCSYTFVKGTSKILLTF